MKGKILVGSLILVYILLSISSALMGGDFDVYLDAAIKLSNHQNIYGPPFFKTLQYYYSPLFALILLPFSGNFFSIELFWLLLSGILLVRVGKLLFNYLDLTILSKKEYYLLIFISSFFILRFLLYNISMIQITIFLLWAIIESIALINSKKWFLGSVLLALAINIKLLPLVTLPYLLFRGKFKASAVVVLFIIIFLFLPAVFIGYDYNSYLLAEWWKVINPTNSEHLIEAGIVNQSLIGTIPVFLTETVGELDFSRNILSLSAETAERITNIFRLIFIVFTLYFLKYPLSKSKDSFEELRAISYITLLVPLIFPHQQKYAFIFIFPMLIYLSYYSLLMWKYNRTKKFKIYLALLLLTSIILSPLIGSDIIGRFNYDFLQHFRILGLTVISLIFFAVLAKPSKINEIIAKYRRE